MKRFGGFICINKHQYALSDSTQSFGDSVPLQKQLQIRLCVKSHYPTGKDENFFLATTTFYNKAGSQQPHTTAKPDEIKLLNSGSESKAAAKSSRKAAPSTHYI